MMNMSARNERDAAGDDSKFSDLHLVLFMHVTKLLIALDCIAKRTDSPAGTPPSPRRVAA